MMPCLNLQRHFCFALDRGRERDDDKPGGITPFFVGQPFSSKFNAAPASKNLCGLGFVVIKRSMMEEKENGMGRMHAVQTINHLHPK